MARLERLVNLISALLEANKPLSREEIQRRVPGYAQDAEAFRRAFERDKASLREMGLPVSTELLDPNYPEEGSGYLITKNDYALPDIGLNRDEMDALALAASVVRLQHADEVTHHALAKLGAGLRNTDERAHAVELVNDDRLATLFAARSALAPVTFCYRKKTRTVHVHRLSCRGGHWYVHGFEIGANDQRTFRLDRIESALTVGEQNGYVPPTEHDNRWLPTWEMGDAPAVEARVRVDREFVAVAQRQTEASPVNVDEHGNGEFLFRVVNEDAFGSFVLSFLEHAEILSPEPMRTRFVARVQSALEHHTAGAL